MEVDGLRALADSLTRAVERRDGAAFVSLWPATAVDYARSFFTRLAKDLPTAPSPVEISVMPFAEGYGMMRLTGKEGRSAELGYCLVNGGLRLVWKYAVNRKKAIAGWTAKSTKYYTVYLSPRLSGSPDLGELDAATGRVAAYFSLKPPRETGEFVLLSRKDELEGAVPPLLNKCDYVDPVTGAIVSTIPDDCHEITHRLFLLAGFPCRALTLMQEGSAEIFNPRPYAAGEKIALTANLVRNMLSEKFFYSDTRNFSYAAVFCNGVIQLLGMARFRTLYKASGTEFIPLLEEYAGCGLDEFLAKLAAETSLPPADSA